MVDDVSYPGIFLCFSCWFLWLLETSLKTKSYSSFIMYARLTRKLIIVQCFTFLCFLLYNYKHWIFYCSILGFHLLCESMVVVSSGTIIDCHFPLFLQFKFICNKSCLLKLNYKLVYILDFYLFSSDVIHCPKCCLYSPEIYHFPTYLLARVFSGVWALWTCHGPSCCGNFEDMFYEYLPFCHLIIKVVL